MKEYYKHYTLDCQAEKIGCKGCGYYKKSADEMFEELGYSLEENTNTRIRYEFQGLYMDNEIVFDRISLCVLKEFSTGESSAIEISELKAINKKMEELGWK